MSLTIHEGITICYFYGPRQFNILFTNEVIIRTFRTYQYNTPKFRERVYYSEGNNPGRSVFACSIIKHASYALAYS